MLSFQKCNCQKLQSLRSVPLGGPPKGVLRCPFNILQNVEGLQLLLQIESSKFSEGLQRVQCQEFPAAPQVCLKQNHWKDMKTLTTMYCYWVYHHGLS